VHDRGAPQSEGFGEDDAKIIASILTFQLRVDCIEDFGFYARGHHAVLIPEDRLMAGVYTLSRLPEKLRYRAMLMPKAGRGCVF
jgi:hypothetical protein